MEKFKINCKNCLENKMPSDKIQTTLEGDSGYSNWTVVDSGKVAFKCHQCGKYGSTNEYDKPNELSNFTVRCLKCDEFDSWDYLIQDVDGTEEPTNITCKKCGNKLVQEGDITTTHMNQENLNLSNNEVKKLTFKGVAGEEIMRLEAGTFYWKGEPIEDKYQIYERFNEWLKINHC